MTTAQENLGRTLLKGLVNLREQNGQITLTDVGQMFVDLSNEYLASEGDKDKILYHEIKRLATYIDEANREIFAIAINEKSETAILDASQHLDAAIKDTEQASNTIMDAADVILANAPGIGGDKEAKIMEATNRIYDACNFQDITGQRITKVIKLLGNIEQRVSKLLSLLNSVGAGKESAAGKVVSINSQPSDQELLNGPQLPGQAATQEEIDQLFASLGGKK